MLNIIITNIHIHNDFLLDDLIGIAGYKGCLEWKDEITAILNRSTELTTEREIKEMIGALVLAGFTVKNLNR